MQLPTEWTAEESRGDKATRYLLREVVFFLLFNSLQHLKVKKIKNTYEALLASAANG